MRESDIENYLVRRVKAMGGEVRKVKWVGRRSAPDRLVMIPPRINYPEFGQIKRTWARTIWVEVKNPSTIKTFPADSREKAQAREHQRMRDMGQRVEVIGTLQQVDELLS